ncbi:metallophosphoesterase family protein [Erysipelothrix anatis]|uniref:metallophosphoesterase family protein n=1 Tax=Erysipelothrix anatis TaxID=2683713 RepID=UPI00140DC26B|nr:YfcE family phosphodiesterase [Erysipelothrix anatis]
MRVAVISDIHSNLHGLKWALRDAENRNVDRYIFLGDYITDGYQDNEVLDLVREYGDILISGNRERIFETFDFDCVPINMKPIAWTYANLTQANRKYIKTLARIKEIELGGYRVLVIHGDGFEHYASIEKAFDALIESYTFDICLFGHSHDAQNYHYRGKYFINPGSVGIPITQAGYQYKIVSFTPKLSIATYNRQTHHNLSAVAEDYKQSQYYRDNPLWASLILRNIITSEDFGPKFWGCFHEITTSYTHLNLDDRWQLTFALYNKRHCKSKHRCVPKKLDKSL